jgi:hypothetical protein
MAHPVDETDARAPPSSVPEHVFLVHVEPPDVFSLLTRCLRTAVDAARSPWPHYEQTAHAVNVQIEGGTADPA